MASIIAFLVSRLNAAMSSEDEVRPTAEMGGKAAEHPVSSKLLWQNPPLSHVARTFEHNLARLEPLLLRAVQLVVVLAHDRNDVALRFDSEVKRSFLFARARDTQSIDEP